MEAWISLNFESMRKNAKGSVEPDSSKLPADKVIGVIAAVITLLAALLKLLEVLHVL